MWRSTHGDYAEKHRKRGNGFGLGLVQGLTNVARTLSACYYKGSEITSCKAWQREPAQAYSKRMLEAALWALRPRWYPTAIAAYQFQILKLTSSSASRVVATVGEPSYRSSTIKALVISRTEAVPFEYGGSILIPPTRRKC